MNENIAAWKFLTQKFVNEINVNYGSWHVYNVTNVTKGIEIRARIWPCIMTISFIAGEMEKSVLV